MWLSGKAVKTQLQIVLIRLFAVTDGYPISVKNGFFKNIFFEKKIKKNKKIFLKNSFLTLIEYPSVTANSLISTICS